jgi:hypothetical protein
MALQVFLNGPLQVSTTSTSLTRLVLSHLASGNILHPLLKNAVAHKIANLNSVRSAKKENTEERMGF